MMYTTFVVSSIDTSSMHEFGTIFCSGRKNSPIENERRFRVAEILRENGKRGRDADLSCDANAIKNWTRTSRSQNILFLISRNHKKTRQFEAETPPNETQTTVIFWLSGLWRRSYAWDLNSATERCAYFHVCHASIWLCGAMTWALTSYESISNVLRNCRCIHKTLPSFVPRRWLYPCRTFSTYSTRTSYTQTQNV